MLYLFKSNTVAQETAILNAVRDCKDVDRYDDAICNMDDDGGEEIAFFSVCNGEINGIKFITEDEKELDILNKVFSKFFA